MLSTENRKLITKKVGGTIDGVVREQYSNPKHGRKFVQEPRITERVCDRLEQQLNERRIGDYTLEVTAESLPDRGPYSAEKILGADIALSVSLDGEEGFDKTLLIQAKYDTEFDRGELVEACDKMEKVAGKKGTYIWIYTPDGVKVVSPYQVRHMRSDAFYGLYHRSPEGLMGRILDCYAGSKKIGIPKSVRDRRRYLQEMLERFRAKNAVDISLRETRKR
jgi:hypothetical protein